MFSSQVIFNGKLTPQTPRSVLHYRADLVKHVPLRQLPHKTGPAIIGSNHERIAIRSFA